MNAASIAARVKFARGIFDPLQAPRFGVAADCGERFWRRKGKVSAF
jgi:hypothetical protein